MRFTRTIFSLLQNEGWWSDAEDKEFRQFCRKSVLDAMAKAEKKLKPNPMLLFTDVYDRIPPHLREQMTQQMEHVKNNKERYPLESFRPMQDPEL